MVVGEGNKLVPRPVKLGGMSGTRWTILSGLQGGEQVMVEGHMKAYPGSVVKPVPWTPTPAAAPATQGK